MPDSTVRQDGSGDFTTLAAALADVGTGVGDTITIEEDWTIDDTAAATVADDDITIQTDNDSYHCGFYDESTQHYRLVVSGDHCITVSNDDVTIDGLAIVQSGVGVSDECVRIGSVGSHSFRNLILKAETNTTAQDGLYVGNTSLTMNVENVIAYNFGRAAFLGQPNVVATQTWNMNSCTAWNNNRTVGAEGGGMAIRRLGGTPTYFINCFNCVFVGNNGGGAGGDFEENGVSGSATWNIDNCIDSDNSIAGLDVGAVDPLPLRTPTDVLNPGVGDFVIFKDITTEATYNLLLQDNADENDAQDAHSATTGAGLTLPVLDIEKDVRETGAGLIDIGADSIITPPTPPGEPFPEYGQLRAAIGDPPVYGATILRS